MYALLCIDAHLKYKSLILHLRFVHLQESYVEIQTEHLPNLMRQVTDSIIQNHATLSDAELMLCFKLCSKILSRVEPSMCPVSDLPSSPTSSAPPSPAKRPISKPLSEAQKRAMEDVLDGRSLAEEEEEENGGDGNVDDDGEIYVGDGEKGNKDGQKNNKVVKIDGVCEDESSSDLTSGDSSSTSAPQKLPNGDVPRDANESQSCGKKHYSSDDSSDTDSQVDDIRRPRALSASAVTIMQACLQSFRRLFGVFVTSRLLRDRDLALQLAQKLVIQKSESSDKLELANIDEDELDVYSQEGVTEQTCDAFQFSCRLLMDFSAFPLFCDDSQRVLKQSFKKGMIDYSGFWIY